MPKKSAREARESTLASGWTIEPDAAGTSDLLDVGKADGLDRGGFTGPEGSPDADAEGLDDGRQQLSNGMLVMLGVFGGLYLLYTWIWLSWVQGYAEWNAMIAAGSGTVGAVFQQAAFWVVPLAPVLWFLTVMALSRGGRTKRLVIGILIGAVVLVPLPMFFGGGA